MDGAFSRAVLAALCVVSLALPACSSEEADRRGMDDGSGEAGRSGAAVDAGPASAGRRVAGGAGGAGGRLEIENAVLSSAGKRDLIHVTVEFSGPGVWPRCLLVDGPSRGAVLETLARRDPPEAQGWTRALWTESLWAEQESRWSDRRDAEASLTDDGTLLLVFREAPVPKERAADPRRTPFFARCAGGNRSAILRDEAHVDGSPEARS